MSCVFEANAVRAVAEAEDVQVTATVYTGLWGRSDSVWLAFPIWRVDDGPVYGIPWEQCQLARAKSLTAVSRGAPATMWPEDAPCANVTYDTLSRYSHVISLSEGTHTLWTGMQEMAN